jgi:inorganic triphosphatase YgiF
MSSEVEFKFAVAHASAFERLAEHLLGPGARLPAPARQTNRFFDTPDLALRAARLALRLREESGRWTLTAKGRSESAGALSRRPEHEVELSATEAGELAAGRRDVLELFAQKLPGDFARRLAVAADGRPVAQVGSFVNERTVLGPVPLPGSGRRVTFELDRATFPGPRVDCEIEVELDGDEQAEAVGAELEDLLRAAGIEWTRAPSKASRLFEALEGPRAARP